MTRFTYDDGWGKGLHQTQYLRMHIQSAFQLSCLEKKLTTIIANGHLSWNPVYNTRPMQGHFTTTTPKRIRRTPAHDPEHLPYAMQCNAILKFNILIPLHVLQRIIHNIHEHSPLPHHLPHIHTTTSLLRSLEDGRRLLERRVVLPR